MLNVKAEKLRQRKFRKAKKDGKDMNDTYLCN